MFHEYNTVWCIVKREEAAFDDREGWVFHSPSSSHLPPSRPFSENYLFVSILISSLIPGFTRSRVGLKEVTSAWLHNE